MLDAKGGITHAHQRETCFRIQLEVVVPEVHEQLSNLQSGYSLGRLRRIRVTVGGLRGVLWDVDVDDTEAVFDGPVNVTEDSVRL